MRITQILCDRCRSEMLPGRRNRPLEVEAWYRPREGSMLGRTRVHVELCDACRESFAAWLGDRCILPGLAAATAHPIEDVDDVVPEEVVAEPAEGARPVGGSRGLRRKPIG